MQFHLTESYLLEKLNLGKRENINTKVISSRPIELPTSSPNYYWGLNKVAFSLLPLAPGARRKTIFEEIVKNEIWTMDQIQGIVNVNVPVRSTIIKLKEGGLFVYNPLAPTKEVLDFFNELQSKHGKVKYIVLGSLGLEHKSLAASFSQYFTNAQVYLQPGQWSFPFNLPDSFLGFPLGRSQSIPLNIEDAPWKTDFDHLVLEPLRFKSVGGFSETAFFHKKTQTLLVTDVIIKVPNEPPPIIAEDPRALLYHARDSMLDVVKDTKEERLKGWRRMVLFSLIFFPSGIIVEKLNKVFSLLSKISPDMELLGRGSIPFNGGIYAWSWIKSEIPSFKSFQGGLVVAPILQKLILNRESKRVLEWATTISNKWNIKRIIPCHFENNIQTNSKEFRRAFTFLEKKIQCPQPLEEDLSLLTRLSDIFSKLGIVDYPDEPIINN